MIDRDKRKSILSCLVEGNSIRGTARIVGCAKNTVMSALVETGKKCLAYHDDMVGNVPCEHIQVDEIWSKVDPNVTPTRALWVWVAMCEETKLVPTWAVGPRTAGLAKIVMQDLKARLDDPDKRIQITTDGNTQYRDAIEDTFGERADYAVVQKVYEREVRKERFKKCLDIEVYTVQGKPKDKHITTSHIERQNLTMRTNIKRMTRKTNGNSKSFNNHAHAMALHFFYMNFIRIHRTIGITPAMAAGVDNRIWDLDDLVDLSIHY